MSFAHLLAYTHKRELVRSTKERRGEEHFHFHLGRRVGLRGVIHASNRDKKMPGTCRCHRQRDKKKRKIHNGPPLLFANGEGRDGFVVKTACHEVHGRTEQKRRSTMPPFPLFSQPCPICPSFNFYRYKKRGHSSSRCRSSAHECPH